MAKIREIEWHKNGINIKVGDGSEPIKCIVGNLKFDLKEDDMWDYITSDFVRGLYSK